MLKIKDLLQDVQEDIRPDKNYEKKIFEKLNDIIEKINRDRNGVRAILGGSGAKGTWLKTFDADIFVLFDYGKYADKSDKISSILEKMLKRDFRKVVRLHGSRDYFQIKQPEFTFEIVPILDIRSARQAKNITDVSPLHSKWVAKHKELIGEIKLTKQFCKAQNIYGAESYIRGFSGYVCEILTINYGSFLKLIKSALKWGDKTVVDVEKHYKGQDVFRIMNASKLASPLIVVDPVQKERNAAAALSPEKFNSFRNAARALLEWPSKSFFEGKSLDSVFSTERPRDAKLIKVNARPQEGKIDIIGGRLLKIYEHLCNEFRKHNFAIIRSDWEWDRKDEAIYYFLFSKAPLKKSIEVKGPPAKMKEHVAKFRKAHRSTFMKSNRVYALIPRKFINSEDLLKVISRDGFVLERCEGMSFEVKGG